MSWQLKTGFMRKNWFIVVIGFLVIVLAGTMFQNCAGGGEKESDPNKSSTVDESTAGFGYYYSAGSLPPDHYYSYEYQVNFKDKVLTISVKKGEQVTAALPTPGTITLTDIQITEIRNLLNKVEYVKCVQEELLAGAPLEYVEIYSQSMDAPTIFVFEGHCFGVVSDRSFLARTNFDELEKYLFRYPIPFTESLHHNSQ